MDLITANATDDGLRIDAGRIECGELIERRVAGAPTGTDFFVAITSTARAAMDAHAYSTIEVEVGGVLLGRPYRDGERPFLLIDAIIPALAAEQRGANVTFTADTWTQIHAIIDDEHPGASIVGWYHTHPNFGIFLSEMDVFIQRHFFDLPQQVAIVIDPVAKTEGCFIWRDGTPVRDVIHPEHGPASAPFAETSVAAAAPALPPAGALAFARDDDRPPTAFADIVRRHVATVDAQRTAADRGFDAARGAWIAARRWELRQIAAAAVLATIVVIVFGCLIVLIVRDSPPKIPQPMKAGTADRSTGPQPKPLK